MGALKGPLRKTYITFLIGTLALAGIVPFAGFFSKDEILWNAFNANKALWVLGVLAAFCTAFYMFRLVFLTFFGESRLTHEAKHHLHESPNRMLVPLYILALLSIVGGWIGLPLMPGGNPFTHWLEPVFGPETVPAGEAAGHGLEMGLMALSLGVALIGIYTAWMFYRKNPKLPIKLGNSMKDTYNALLHKYYVDEIYGAAIVRPFFSLSRGLWNFFDVQVVDGVVNGVGRFVRGAGGKIRGLQSGYVGGYALAMVLGLVVVISLYFIR
jgi:NADH-quinone oxidoreductase subunit L